MKAYSNTFKETMVQKMTGPHARSATSLAAEIGVPQTTLSRWLLQYAPVDTGSSAMKAKKQPNNWPAEKKLVQIIPNVLLRTEAKLDPEVEPRSRAPFAQVEGANQAPAEDAEDSEE